MWCKFGQVTVEISTQVRRLDLERRGGLLGRGRSRKSFADEAPVVLLLREYSQLSNVGNQVRILNRFQESEPNRRPCLLYHSTLGSASCITQTLISLRLLYHSNLEARVFRARTLVSLNNRFKDLADEAPVVLLLREYSQLSEARSY